MPYKCNACGMVYWEGSKELKDIMRTGGCNCGKKFLMYVRTMRDLGVEDSLGKSGVGERIVDVVDKQSEVGGLSDGLAGGRGESFDWLDREFLRMREQGKSLQLGIETIRILEEGKYQIDIGSLMRGKPIIVRTEEGVYYIDLAHAMKKK